MADWIDTLYENNWHEMPELDVEKIEQDALQMATAHIRDQRLRRLAHERKQGGVMSEREFQSFGSLYGPGSVSDILRSAAQFHAGYMSTVQDIMEKLRTGTLSPEHLEEMREAQRKEQRGRYPGT